MPSRQVKGKVICKKSTNFDFVAIRNPWSPNLSIYLSIYYLICESLVLDKRHRRGEMVATTIAMLVSHDTTTKGGRLPWFTFFIYALPFEIWSQTWVASMHWERNKYDCFNNLIEMIVEFREIALPTRATPGSSLVLEWEKKLKFWQEH